MPLSLNDVRFTTRKSGAHDLQLYPKLLRDRSFLPRIDVTIQYFESMLGHERREFDGEVLVHFFGDHKLARCMVACLARSYRFHTPRLEQLVSRAGLRKLERASIDSPRALRLRLYDEVNDFGHGFLPSADRQTIFGKLEHQLGLRGGQLERLLYLDAEEHAILARLGREPLPADVAAQYNFAVLSSLLRHAAEINLALAGWTTADGEALRALCSANSIEASLSRDGALARLQLRGRQDAMGVWARHGRKLARTVVQLLERSRPAAVDGTASLMLRDRRLSLRLTPEVLDILAGAPAPCTGWTEAPSWESATVAEVLAALRPPRPGWGLRRLPEPQAWAAGVVVPDLLVQVDGQPAQLCIVRSPEHGARLTPLAQAATTGEPFVFVGPADALAPLQAVAATCISLARPEPGALLCALEQTLRSANGEPAARTA